MQWSVDSSFHIFSKTGQATHRGTYTIEKSSFRTILWANMSKRVYFPFKALLCNNCIIFIMFYSYSNKVPINLCLSLDKNFFGRRRRIHLITISPDLEVSTKFSQPAEEKLRRSTTQKSSQSADLISRRRGS